MSGAAAGLGLLAALIPAACIASQGQAELLRAFDRAVMEWQSSSPEGRPVAARAASNAFLRLRAGPERRARLVAGSRATLTSGRPELAHRLAMEVEERAQPPALAEVRLRALAQLGRLPAFAAALASVVPRTPTAAQAALQQEEAKLLPLAAAALRGTDRASGRAVFEAIAALEPFQSYRLANLGLCLRQIGDLEAAERAYELGRQRAPEDLELWNDYGLLLRATGRRNEALAAFRQSVALDLARDDSRRATGPAITNLMHMEALAPGGQGADPVPTATASLVKRPDATMLRRLTVDVLLDRLARR